MSRPAGYDVADYFAEGGDPEKIDAAFEAAPEYTLTEDVDFVASTDATGLLVRWNHLGDVQAFMWVVESLVPCGGLTIMYAGYGLGKSLIALEWAARASLEGPVVYIVAEGWPGFQARLAAWEKLNGPPGALYVYRRPLNFLNPHEVADFEAEIARIEAEEGQPVRLIVIDTISRCSAGADENSARDMGLLVEAFGRLQEPGRAVLGVHHADKGNKGARGSSLIPAAADAIHRVKASGTRHTVTVEKMKDGSEPIEAQFERQIVDLGEIGTAPAVVPLGQSIVGEQQRPAISLTPQRREVLVAISRLLAEGTTPTHGAIKKRVDLPLSTFNSVLQWARDERVLVGGGGDPYRPGDNWPDSIPLDLGPIKCCPEGHGYRGAECEQCHAA